MGALYFLEIQSADSVNESVANTSDTSIAESDFVAGSASDISDMAEYKAQVGMFTLTLDPAYTIGVEVDGSVDGVSSSQLVVGRSSQANSSLVSLAVDDYVKVGAYPSAQHGSRDQFANNDTTRQAGLTSESRVNISGVEARRFESNGIGKTIKYFFERNGVTYVIEAWDISTGDTNVMLDDVLAGFNFN